MPSYTLYYFNGRGRAEICRLMFAAAGVPYNDKRIDFGEWGNYRTKMPCSMMPVLEIDGKIQIPQSMAIARYLAREFDFYGKNSIEMAKIDYICDSFYELFDDFMRMFHEKDGRLYSFYGQRPGDPEKRMNELRLRFQGNSRRILPFLEKTLEMEKSGNQFFMGDQLTMADMMCYATLENPLQENPSMLTNYPKLQGLRTRVFNHLKMVPYFKKRSQTDF